MQINNHPSYTAININNHQKGATDALGKLATGKQKQLDDASLALIAHALGNELNTLGQGLANANDAIGMMQIADGVLIGLSQSADDLTVLAVRGNNGILSGEQKQMLHEEARAIAQSMQSNLENATFNGASIFGRDLEFSLGTSTLSTRIPIIKIESADLLSQEGISDFMKTVQAAQSVVGSTSVRLESTMHSIFENMKNLAASQSQLADADVAKEMMKYQKEGIMLNASMIAQSHQNNINAERVEQLLL